MNHANIAIFVPHIGCPHRCLFCDQHSVSGVWNPPGKEEVDRAVATAIRSEGYVPQNTQIAFFGGSFTAIERPYMLSLLEAAGKYVQNQTVRSLRISTRPDAITPEILQILRCHGVENIELGAQSMDDAVLRLNERGHTANDTRQACERIASCGLTLGLQMMTGMFGSNPQKDSETARQLIRLSPAEVRIYPTVVLKNTPLALKYQRGEYQPPSLAEAIEQCARLSEQFEKNGIRVIRLGLHSLPKESYLAGPYHPAFAQLCCSRRFLSAFESRLREPGHYEIRVAGKHLSDAIGQKKENLQKLAAKGFFCRITADDSLRGSQFLIERNGENGAAQIHSDSGL